MNFFILYIGHFVQNMKSTFLLLITIKQRYNVCTILKGSHRKATLRRHLNCDVSGVQIHFGKSEDAKAGLYEETQSPVYFQRGTSEISLVQKKQGIYIIICKLNN